jgi:predicted branched-subunit amino acid permease
MSGPRPALSKAPAPASAPVHVTLDGLRRGVALTVPTFPGVVIFGAAFGAAAAAKDLSLAEAVAMSALVFAGLSQMVAMEVWRPEWTWVGIAGLTLLTALVNSRMLLMGAALHPWLRARSHLFNALHLHLLTDANWIIGTRYHEGGGRDVGVLIGSGLTLWVLWVAVTVPGYLAGALVADPKRYALDLVMPVFFAIMLVPMWKGARPALPWVVAGLVALAVARLVPGYAFIMAGALAGALTGALMPPAREEGARG